MPNQMWNVLCLAGGMAGNQQCVCNSKWPCCHFHGPTEIQHRHLSKVFTLAVLPAAPCMPQGCQGGDHQGMDGAHADVVAWMCRARVGFLGQWGHGKLNPFLGGWANSYDHGHQRVTNSGGDAHPSRLHLMTPRQLTQSRDNGASIFSHVRVDDPSTGANFTFQIRGSVLSATHWCEDWDEFHHLSSTCFSPWPRFSWACQPWTGSVSLEIIASAARSWWPIYDHQILPVQHPFCT